MPLTPRPRHAPPGFTLVELLMAIALTLLVGSVVVRFYAGQSRAVAGAARRADAVQTARFALAAVDRDLRMIGVGTLADQPMLVYADAHTVVFNADLSTLDPDDVHSVAYAPDADPAGVRAMQPPASALPRGPGLPAMSYPSAAFRVPSGTEAPAETIAYWVSPDSSSARPNEWVLRRQVNRLPPVVVATGLVIPAGQPFFQYTWVRDASGTLDSVRAAQLPLRHDAARHGAPDDVDGALAARIDRVRAVTVRASGQFREPGPAGALRQRAVRGTTALVNVTALRRPTCGAAPDAVPSVRLLATVGGQPDYVRLAWMSASDDGAGEKDVERYLIYRRENGAPFAEPLASVPAESRSGVVYTFDDYDVKRPPTAGRPTSNDFVYGVVAQDCQPQVSPQAPTPVLAVPVVN